MPRSPDGTAAPARAPPSPPPPPHPWAALALAEAIKTAMPPGSGAAPPVILVSSAGIREKGHRGIDAALTKPIKPSALHDALVTVLAGSPAGGDRPGRTAERPVVDGEL